MPTNCGTPAEARVDEESPQVVAPRYEGSAGGNVVGQQHEADRVLTRVDGPVPRPGVRRGRCFGKRSRDSVHEGFLSRRDPQALDRAAIALRDCPQRHQFRRPRCATVRRLHDLIIAHEVWRALQEASRALHSPGHERAGPTTQPQGRRTSLREPLTTYATSTRDYLSATVRQRN